MIKTKTLTLIELVASCEESCRMQKNIKEVKSKMIELSVGIIIGIILGATAMSLCAAAKERDKR